MFGRQNSIWADSILWTFYIITGSESHANVKWYICIYYWFLSIEMLFHRLRLKLFGKQVFDLKSKKHSIIRPVPYLTLDHTLTLIGTETHKPHLSLANLYSMFPRSIHLMDWTSRRLRIGVKQLEKNDSYEFISLIIQQKH